MAENKGFLQVKAAAITGAVVGFLWGLVSAISRSVRAPGIYRAAGVAVNATTGYPTTVHPYTGVGWLLMIVAGLVGGAIVGAIIALVYNWAAKMK